MEESIRNTLNNEITQEKLRVGREKFISEHVFGFNGQATQRIAKIITNMIAEKPDNQ